MHTWKTVVRAAVTRATVASILVSVAGGALLTGASAATAATAPSQSATPVTGRPAVPPHGVLLGAAVSGRPGSSAKSSVTDLEAEIGRKLDVHRLYDVWDDPQPGPMTSWTVAGGRTPVLSIKASRRDGSVVRWADIAAGREDPQIRAQARGLKALNAPLFLSLQHEPENDPGNGTAADYVAAWRHYVAVFRSENVTNVSFTWILMAWSFERPTIADSFYPGDDVIDWVAADGYNWYGTSADKPWRPLGDAISGFYDWGTAHHKPMMIAEYGSLEDPQTPGRKAAWITDAAAAIKTMPGIKAVLYFHSPVGHPWWVNSSASSTAAFATMGGDRYFSATGGVSSTPALHTVADFDGNGSTDLSVYRPSTGSWYARGVLAARWGAPGDVPVPADYNGDRRADVALWRPANGRWYIRGVPSFGYGTTGDLPVPADYTGDGRAAAAVFRPATGTWWVRGAVPVAYGQRGDIPVPGDYNGDGRTEAAVFRPATGTWWVRGAVPVAYGQRGDIPVPGDYNGDGRTEAAVFRPATGTWWIRGTAPVAYGQRGDIPVPGDYNGDGRTEAAIWRPATGTWWIRGRPGTAWGVGSDHPLPLPPGIRIPSGM